MASSSNKTTQPGGACNGTAADYTNIEQELYDYQMHMKMCKKIAQLTKVIYALNTKCDEHDSSLQALKEAHQEEIEQIMEETQEKILKYKSQGEEETDLHQRLQAMEETLEQYERLKDEALTDFETYRRQTEERELKSQTEHAERIMALSTEMVDLKKDFEGKLQALAGLKEQLEQEKEKAQAELERTNQESQSLQDECRELRRNSMGERSRLEEMCQTRTRALREELERLRAERLRLAEEFEQKVSSLKAAHQEEQESLKRTLQQSLTDTLTQWQQRELEHRNAMQASLQQKLKRMEGELEAKGQQLNECRRHSLKLQDRMQDLETQLEEAHHKVAEAVASMKKSEEEMSVAKERLILQENELLNKSEELLSQCSSQSKASAQADEFKRQVLQLQKRVKELEQQDGGKASDHAQHVKQHVEALSAQKQELQRAHVEEVRRVRRQTEEEKARLKEQLMKKLEDLVKKHTAELKSVQTTMENERKAKKDLQTQVEELKRKMESERNKLEKDKKDISSRLEESVSEISRLKSLIQCSECSTEQTAPPEAPCTEHRERWKGELHQAKSCSLQCKKELWWCIGTYFSHTESQEELKQQEEKHHIDITALKKEKDKLEEKSLRQVERSHEEQMSQLQKDKDAEIKELEASWQNKMKDLQSQIEEQKIKSGTEGSYQGPDQLTKEVENLKLELQETKRINQSLLAQLETVTQGKQKNIENHELKSSLRGPGRDACCFLSWAREVEGRLWWQYEEALRAEKHSHQLALQALEESAQAELQAERQRQQERQKTLLERQKAELTQQHAGWCKQVAQRHMKQIEELQAELRTHTELMALQQDFRQQSQVQAFERQLEECQREVLGLRKENVEQREQMACLRSEVELKTREIQQLQEAEQHQRRSWEEDILAGHNIEVECLKRDHRKEIQTIVSDFSSAQTRLQARIVSLETELKEKDENAKRQGSRMDDLHIIGKLQDKLSERDHVIKRLVEERRCHQSPQVNPEGSIVKSYENHPHPGSLTPTLKKKKMEEMPPRVTSVPNLSSYEKSFQGYEVNPDGRCPQAAKSPSFEHGRSAFRTNNRPAPAPELKPGSSCQWSKPVLWRESQRMKVANFFQTFRSPVEQKCLDQGAEVQDPQRQEWFTKYFSF
uniref:Family with sequence similarity 184 member B n=1 Tax=Lepisosteus oculatus TaxID=7918 RepID=W5M655_LEPOC